MKLSQIDKSLAQVVSNDGYGWRDNVNTKPKPVKLPKKKQKPQAGAPTR